MWPGNCNSAFSCYTERKADFTEARGAYVGSCRSLPDKRTGRCGRGTPVGTVLRSHVSRVLCRHGSYKQACKSVSGAENAAVQLLATALTAAVFVVLKQGFTVRIQVGDWLPILWLGLVNTGMGVYLYFSSMGSLSAQSVAV